MAAVLVHGRDQDEQVMLDVARRLRLDDVAYRMPVHGARTWYPARYFDPLEVHGPSLHAAARAIDDAIAATGLPDERIVLGGFSQGACLVAEYAAGSERRFAGVAVLTGALMGTPAQRAARTPSTPPGQHIVLVCSRHDDWVAIEDVHATAEAFARAGAQLTVETSDDRVHHVSDRAVELLRGCF